MVLMLAVIHHLILREQLPLAHIAELCALLPRRRWLVLEWVPPLGCYVSGVAAWPRRSLRSPDGG